MDRQLEVIKADGSREAYLQTKVMGTLSLAFGLIQQTDIYLAQELAEVVTYYLYHDIGPIRKRVHSSEIFSMIKVVLTTTNHDAAAAALSEYHYDRQLKRNRTEVACIDIQTLADARRCCDHDTSCHRTKWSKSEIVRHLTEQHNLPRQSARAVASMVEEKVFKMDLTVIPSSLIRLLALNETALVLRAQDTLHLDSSDSTASENVGITT